MGLSDNLRLRLPGNGDAAGERKYYGVVGDFDTPEDLLRAVRTVRAAGYRKLDAFTPFPIHGIDDAMGERRSHLGRIVMVCGLLGLAAAVFLQWWTGAIDYPLSVAGKPKFAVQPSVPIMFELTVLLASFAAVIGMLALNGLPKFYHPIFNYSRQEGSTNDRFLLAIEARDPKFQTEEVKLLLDSLGSRCTELVEA